MDVEKIRKDFPILKRVVFLASASVAPMPISTVDAMKETLDKMYVEYDKEYTEELDACNRCRDSAGDLLNADPDEVALIRNTTEGVNAFASGVSWKRGDNVVINDLEYPANVIPWYHQATRKGLEVRVVKSVSGQIRLGDLEEKVDDRTRVVAVSHVEFSTGFKHDLKELSKIAREHDAYLFVDAIQSLGAVRFDVKELGVDAVSAGGYKWMCGPIGTGILYIRRDLISEINPSYVGFGGIEEEEAKKMWNDLVEGRPFVRDYGRLSGSAKRFEYGSTSSIDFLGLDGSIRYLLNIGLEEIEDRIRNLTDYLFGRLGEKKFEVMTPLDGGRRAGIVNFRPPVDFKKGDQASRFRKALAESKVKVDSRGGGVRVSCHFFNTKEDIDEMLEAVEGGIQRSRSSGESSPGCCDEKMN